MLMMDEDDDKGSFLYFQIWGRRMGTFYVILICHTSLSSYLHPLLTNLPSSHTLPSSGVVFSAAAEDFVRSMLCYDESQRPSAATSCEHRWLRDDLGAGGAKASTSSKNRSTGRKK